MFKQPLFQCLLLGFVIFVLYLVADPGSQNDKNIVVTKNDLLTFMQYRARAFDEKRAERAWNVMQPEDVDRLVADYLRDEVLYREARALGMSDEDFVIRQRLIQKAEYLLQGAQQVEPLSEEALKEYFDKEKERYYQRGTVTFSHVFLKQADAIPGVEVLLADATVSETLELGDRFPYHKNYVDSSLDEVAAHFGRAFADKLAGLSTEKWHGPLKSAYGFHFVFVEAINEGRYPSLDEVQDRVRDDATRARDDRVLQAAVEELKAHYEITVELE